MNLVLVTLESFLTNETQNVDLNALFSEKIETIFFAMSRHSLLYMHFKYKHSVLHNCLKASKRKYVMGWN